MTNDRDSQMHDDLGELDESRRREKPWTRLKSGWDRFCAAVRRMRLRWYEARLRNSFGLPHDPIEDDRPNAPLEHQLNAARALAAHYKLRYEQTQRKLNVTRSRELRTADEVSGVVRETEGLREAVLPEMLRSWREQDRERISRGETATNPTAPERVRIDSTRPWTREHGQSNARVAKDVRARLRRMGNIMRAPQRAYVLRPPKPARCARVRIDLMPIAGAQEANDEQAE
jgi:hypothetical protein